MTQLWNETDSRAWKRSLDRYGEVVTQQGVERLPELDRWYREELPENLRSRRRPHVTLPELVRATEWKMARGVWRAPNLVRVRGNDADLVKETSARALAETPDPTAPIATMAKLDGVGPATASAIAAAYAPEVYPFFDELVAAQVPELGKVAWTMSYYRRYAAALRDRAAALGNGWTPVMLERALWANVGGKAGG